MLILLLNSATSELEIGENELTFTFANGVAEDAFAALGPVAKIPRGNALYVGVLINFCKDLTFRPYWRILEAKR